MVGCGLIWTPCDWLNKLYSFYMEAVVVITSEHDLKITACHKNQLYKTKLSLHKPLLHYYSGLIQLYIRNKMECFSYVSYSVKTIRPAK